MKLTLRQLFPYLVALLGVLITLAGTGLFIASFSQPAFRMPAVGIHLAGWGVLLLGFRLVSLQTKQYQQVPLPQEPSLPEDYLPIGEVPLQTPRTVHFRPSIRFARWFLLLLLLVRLGHSLWYGSVDISELNALQKHGQATQAQVINNVALAGYANYAFRVNATAMVSSFPVPPSEAKNYPLGKYLPLVYLPDNPQIYRLGTVNAEVIRGQMGGWFLLGLQGLLVIGLPFLLLERRWQREMRLARDGSIATGQVTESNPVSVGGRTPPTTSPIRSSLGKALPKPDKLA